MSRVIYLLDILNIVPIFHLSFPIALIPYKSLERDVIGVESTLNFTPTPLDTRGG